MIDRPAMWNVRRRAGTARAGRRLSLLSLALLLASLLVATGARADGEGYIDNWNGDIGVELRAALSGSVQTLHAPQQLPSLRAVIIDAWNTPIPGPGGTQQRIADLICERIGSSADEFARSALGTGAKLLRCDIPREGELRGRMSGIDALSLKYITRAAFRARIFTPSGIPGSLDPEVQGTFDIVVRTDIKFGSQVDGRDSHPESGPASRSDPQVTFENVHMASASIVAVIAPALLRVLEAKVSAFRLDGESQRALNDRFTVAGYNRDLHGGAKGFAALIQQLHPELGTVFPVFTYTVQIDDNAKLVIQYHRGGSPPQVLPGCSCGPMCGDQVSCVCQAAGIIQENDNVALHFLMPNGRWTLAANSSSDFMNGKAFGAQTGDVLTYRMCRLNQFGSSCTQPFRVNYIKFGACAPPGQSGGGGTTHSAPSCGGPILPACPPLQPLKQ